MLGKRLDEYIPCTAAYENRDMSLALVLLKKYPNCQTMIMGDGDSVVVLKKYLKRVHDIDVELVLSGLDIVNNQNVTKKSKWIIYNLDRKYSNDLEYRSIINQLIEKNISSEFKIVDMSTYIYDLFYVSFVSYFICNKSVLIDNETIWADDISKEIYEEYIMSFVEGRNYCGLTMCERTKYFGLSDNDLFDFSEDQSWINVGASTGDTLFWSELNNIHFKKIYAIEGEKSAVTTLEKNLKYSNLRNICVIPKYCGTEKDAYKLDDIIDNIALINMDIEGAEKEALLSGRQLIKKNKPILAICAYHLADDLIELPKLIKDIDSSYEFYLRKYQSGTGRHYHAIHKVNELVLYAIPNSEK